MNRVKSQQRQSRSPGLRKALLVEPDEAVRSRVQPVLSDYVQSVSVTSSFGDAMDAIQREEVDFLIAAIDLPGGSGLELAARLNEGDIDAPILLLAARGQEHDAVKVLKFRTSNFMTWDEATDFEILLPPIVDSLIERLTRRSMQIEAETSLKESEQRFRDLVNAAPICIHEIGLDGRLTSMNRTGLDMMGCDMESEVCGLNYLDVPVDEDKERIAGLLEKARGGEASQFTFRVAVNDEIMHFESCFQPMFREDGSVDRLMGLTANVTERMRAEERLREATKEAERASIAKSEFLAMMSHDLRTPLNAIVGFSELIQSGIFGPVGDERYGEYLDDIHHSGLFLLSLVNDILDISKIEAGEYRLSKQPIDMREIAEFCFRQTKVQASQNGVMLSAELDDLPVPLWADRRALVQILNNLVSNGIKFSEPGTMLSLGARNLDDGAVEVTVSDQGCGMSEKEVARALRPFEQADRYHARRQDGTGLGLYLCANLMRLHGGEIGISSTVGAGTTVRLVFPARDIGVDGTGVAKSA